MSIIFRFSRLTTHTTSSSPTPATLAAFLGPLLFGLGSPALPFHHTYGAFLRCSHAEHLLLSYIHAQPGPMDPPTHTPTKLTSAIERFVGAYGVDSYAPTKRSIALVSFVGINASQLAAVYDYIIVGGGQSGVVIGSRLSETNSYFEDNPPQLEPSSAVTYSARDLFNATIVSEPGIGNRVGAVYTASVIGGGSAVNGMLFDCGSAVDYNATKFTPSRADLAADYNITWDIDAANGNGPIQVTFPDWQWPGVKIQFKVWSEVGVPINYESAAGNTYGAYWVPSNVDQQYHRSYARNAYFDLIASCQNLKVLTGYRVNESSSIPTNTHTAIRSKLEELQTALRRS
ncbi:GMC oxidoreductase [Sphaerobolus stellatus SS14]|uniref:GMC oxidoreductase n=1 Tax=Sphaerobolus stellatus (strain SS14) TaxID=990650 RepID=A0A0C9V230_SPHS4|nr:GMC oxidoreductase [Sphaerobolus stellatus SS14]